MCGRARCSLAPERVASASGVPQNRWVDRESYRPRYNVSPGGWLPVVRNGDNGETTLHTMRWGLIPSYTKQGEKLDFYRMFNARCETVCEKSAFRRLVASKRCVIVVNGFYEWKADKHVGKQPYYINFGRHEDDCMKFAGLFDCWSHTDDGKPMFSCTILTTDSSERLTWLHDRMPVILRTSVDERAWLNGDMDAAQLRGIARPYNGKDLLWYPVTPALNKPSFDGPECSKELKKPSIASFFSKPKAESATITAKDVTKEAADALCAEGIDIPHIKDCKPDDDVDDGNTAREHTHTHSDVSKHATSSAKASDVKHEFNSSVNDPHDKDPNLGVKEEEAADLIEPHGTDSAVLGKHEDVKHEQKVLTEASICSDTKQVGVTSHKTGSKSTGAGVAGKKGAGTGARGTKRGAATTAASPAKHSSSPGTQKKLLSFFTPNAQ